MPACQVPAAIQGLYDYLEGLTDRASIESLRTQLARMDVSMDDLREYAIFDEGEYRRNLVVSGEWFEILVICWRSGQRSPIHDHAHSTCGVRVLEGVATETIFDHSPCGQVLARSSSDLAAGGVCASQDTDTHQISNLQPAGQDLVTLHIYSPPLRSMACFSITGEAVGSYVPKNFEYVHGDGI